MKLAFRIALLLLMCVLTAPNIVYARTLAETLSGHILLQVQSRGEAWYVDPITKQRYYLGRPEDAYALMRAKGLGIRHAELTGYLRSRFPSRLSGRILLDVESHGEAYYIIPGSLFGVYLGQAEDAHELMRRHGLGITNVNLATIPVASGPNVPGPNNLLIVSIPALPPVTPPTSAFSDLEQDAFAQINAYRQSKDLSVLTWNNDIAEVARIHSMDMARGRVAFGHDGFTERARVLQQRMSLTGVAENVAYNDYPSPAQISVEGWIASVGHRANIENRNYALSGMGVARSNDGAYYFTQLFVTP